MNIHEYQAKILLSEFGMPVPRGKLIANEQEIEGVLNNFSTYPIVIKAQVHAGGRGKAGGVKLANSREHATSIARDMFGITLHTKQTGPEGKKVRKLYAEEGSSIDKEYYISAVVDRGTHTVTFIASTEGGMDIEEVAESSPEKIITVRVSLIHKLQGFHVRELIFGLGLDKSLHKDFSKVIHAMYSCVIAKDANQVEINPLIVTKDNKMIALDAKVGFDDNALYRRPDIEALRDKDEEDPTELEAASYGLNYVKMDGNIGCMVNGAGLAMATMDIIQYYGASPANFLDVGGTADKERVCNAFKIILRDSGVKGVVVNIFGGIVKCDMIAQGIVAAAADMNISVPVVVRLSGTNFEKGKEILRNSGLNIIPADDLADAAKAIVEQINK